MPRKNAKSTVATMLANWFQVMEHGQQDIHTACTSYSPRQHWPERKVVQVLQQKQQNRQKPRFVLMLLILFKSPWGTRWGTNHKKGASPSGKAP